MTDVKPMSVEELTALSLITGYQMTTLIGRSGTNTVRRLLATIDALEAETHRLRQAIAINHWGVKAVLEERQAVADLIEREGWEDPKGRGQ